MDAADRNAHVISRRTSPWAGVSTHLVATAAPTAFRNAQI